MSVAALDPSYGLADPTGYLRCDIRMLPVVPRVFRQSYPALAFLLQHRDLGRACGRATGWVLLAVLGEVPQQAPQQIASLDAQLGLMHGEAV
jgi:hypothetical protein